MPTISKSYFRQAKNEKIEIKIEKHYRYYSKIKPRGNQVCCVIYSQHETGRQTVVKEGSNIQCHHLENNFCTLKIITNPYVIIIFFPGFQKVYSLVAFKLILIKCFERGWNAVPNQGTKDFCVFSSSLLDIKIFFSSRSCLVTMDKPQFLKHILHVS